MNGIIANYRGARHTQKDNQMIIVSDATNKEEANALVGKTVIWKSPAGKELKGKVTFAHGGKGAVRVLFETGMPGQSVGTKVDIQ